MKKKNVLLLLSLMLTVGGCSKPETAEHNAERAEKLESVNEFLCFYDVDVMQAQEEYEFDPSYSEATPDSFWLDKVEIKPVDFYTEESLWKTLEKLNKVSVLADTDTTDTLQLTSNSALDFKSFFDIYVPAESSYTFYFNPQSRPDSEEPGVTGTLGIRVTSGSDGSVNSVDAEFNGVINAESDGLVLTFDDIGLNVIKKTSAGPSGMHLADYTDEDRGDLAFGVVQEEDVREFEPAITENTENLDTDLGKIGIEPDGQVCSGVKLFWINDFYINGEDINAARAVCDAVERVSPGMTVVVNGSNKDNVTADMLMELVESNANTFISLYEEQGGECRMDFVISMDEADIEIHPTGKDTLPNTRAIYETDTYTQWVPYKYTHLMHLEFNNAERE